MDRLGEITVPTLVMAGRDDFLFPPAHQRELAAGIPDARLRIIERAGHNPHSEQPDEVMAAIRDFLPTTARLSSTGRIPRGRTGESCHGGLPATSDQGTVQASRTVSKRSA